MLYYLQHSLFVVQVGEKALIALISYTDFPHYFVESQLFGGLAPTGGEMSKTALRNKKRREKQKEKKAGEGSSADDS